MSEYDLLFDAMGSHVRLLIGEPGAGQPKPEEAGEEVRRFIDEFDRTLSRFREDSELCGLNADRRERVPASALMREAVRAGVWAA
ncbi:MAG TPA: hypothetical protein VFN40_13735, partial [Gemmatimonadales bacterium]|nr:hypothetical protein [Gemmatimonadales bacterium]